MYLLLFFSYCWNTSCQCSHADYEVDMAIGNITFMMEFQIIEWILKNWDPEFDGSWASLFIEDGNEFTKKFKFHHLIEAHMM